MQRWIAATVVAVLALTVLLPLLSADAESSLPPCCRRTGKHHCAMMDAARQSAGDGFHAVPAKCPFWPRGIASSHPQDFSISSSALFYGGLLSHPASFPQVEAGFVVSSSRSHQKRGTASLLERLKSSAACAHIGRKGRPRNQPSRYGFAKEWVAFMFRTITAITNQACTWKWNRFCAAMVCLVMLSAGSAYATIFGSVRGVIHDPQHRPLQGASVILRAKSSDWSKSATTNANGEFQFNAVPIGEYSVRVSHTGFGDSEQKRRGGRQHATGRALSASGREQDGNPHRYCQQRNRSHRHRDPYHI